jgi:2-polyprenyl-3-methyl-5-hydroxy-6-metoxy-1,4-benzoquinol methylase
MKFTIKKSIGQVQPCADSWIKSNVQGKSFLDIGPVWETINEKLSVAYHAGASRVTALDLFPQDHEYWAALHVRLKNLNVEYDFTSGNIIDYSGPSFDCVYCSGVIYHCPNPILFLKKLRSLTKETLILKSTIVPDRIENACGTIKLPSGGLIYIPALEKKDKKVIVEYWKEFLGNRPSGGLLDQVAFTADNHWNWWWLFTPNTLQSMCVTAGFTIIEKQVGEHIQELLLK